MKYSLALFLMAALTVVSGCNKRPPGVLAPSPSPVPASAPASLPLSVMDQADMAFTNNNYQAASQGYQSYLRLEPSGSRRDEALFRLALAFALEPAGAPDAARVTASLKQLVDQYPQSPWSPPAKVILALQAGSLLRDQRIRQLSADLEKLKKIDAERRKRP